MHDPTAEPSSIASARLQALHGGRQQRLLGPSGAPQHIVGPRIFRQRHERDKCDQLRQRRGCLLATTQHGIFHTLNLVPSMQLATTFDLHFHAEGITKALVDTFSNAEFRFIVWPYFREYVSDVSSRMYIPPIIIPLSTEQED